MPLKKSVRAKKSPRAKSFRKQMSARWTRFARLVRDNATVAIPLMAICILAAAMVLAVDQPSPSSFGAIANASAEQSAADALAKSAAPVTESSAATMPETADKASDGKASRVTITGCLERSDETFRLKDTSGSDAPKARNWRWGFLKKGPATVQVVDAGSNVRLRDHVGQRVTVSGMLMDREMQVRSLQRVSTSCASPSRVKI